MAHKLILFSLILAGCASRSLNIFDGKEFASVEFVKNYDGDTITVRIEGTEIPVRLRGVDTPEIKSHEYCEKMKAVEARDRAHYLLEHASRISLTNVGREKYGRMLADLLYDGHLLSETLIEAHLGVPYFGKKKERIDWCL